MLPRAAQPSPPALAPLWHPSVVRHDPANQHETCSPARPPAHPVDPACRESGPQLGAPPGAEQREPFVELRYRSQFGVPRSDSLVNSNWMLLADSMTRTFSAWQDRLQGRSGLRVGAVCVWESDNVEAGVAQGAAAAVV